MDNFSLVYLIWFTTKLNGALIKEVPSIHTPPNKQFLNEMTSQVGVHVLLHIGNIILAIDSGCD